MGIDQSGFSTVEHSETLGRKRGAVLCYCKHVTPLKSGGFKSGLQLLL